jgi:hypothetical protein
VARFIAFVIVLALAVSTSPFMFTQARAVAAEKSTTKSFEHFTCSGKVGEYSSGVADRSIGSGDSMCYFASNTALGRIILITCAVGTNCRVIGTVNNDEEEGDWSPIITEVIEVTVADARKPELTSAGLTGRGNCRVADPTGTPLNVRTAPNQKIVSTLRNGVFVTILDRTTSGGTLWVYVGRAKDHAPLGWVFRDYLDCSSDAKTESVKKILISGHYGSGTIVSMTGINTEQASLSYTRTVDDSEEGCSREMGLVDESGHIRRTLEFNQCVRKDLWHGRAETRRANCLSNTVFLEREPPNQLVKFDVKEGYIETDWLDLKTNQLTGDCSGCGGPEKLDTFKTLCPAKYRILGGASTRLTAPLFQARRACGFDAACIKERQLAAIKTFEALGAPPANLSTTTNSHATAPNDGEEANHLLNYRMAPNRDVFELSMGKTDFGHLVNIPYVRQFLEAEKGKDPTDHIQDVQEFVNQLIKPMHEPIWRSPNVTLSDIYWRLLGTQARVT